MTNYEWQRGTFKLPSAEFASFRKAIQDVEQKRQEKVLTLTQDFWKGLTRKEQTDPVAYDEALDRFVERLHRVEDLSVRHHGFGARPRAHSDEMVDTVRGKLARPGEVIGFKSGGPVYSDPKPRRVLRSDVEFPTNRTTTFAEGDAFVSFDKANKTVTWSTTHNNHSVDRARATDLAAAFFDRLGKVRWTHGTGGSMAYHSEFHDEDRSVGGGAAQCSSSYGYLGVAENPNQIVPFTNAKGERIGATASRNRYGQVVGKPVQLDRYDRPIPKPTRKPATPAVTTGAGRAKTTAASTSGSFAPRQRAEAPPMRLL